MVQRQLVKPLFKTISADRVMVLLYHRNYNVFQSYLKIDCFWLSLLNTKCNFFLLHLSFLTGAVHCLWNSSEDTVAHEWHAWTSGHYHFRNDCVQYFILRGTLKNNTLWVAKRRVLLPVAFLLSYPLLVSWIFCCWICVNILNLLLIYWIYKNTFI